MPQQIVRTVDVVECLDDRIHASSDHSNISVVAGETYPSILDKLEIQVCSPEQKAAIDHTLTLPGSGNPVVLKDDIQTYYPTDDLGDFKDAVDTFADLPLFGNSINDMRPVLDENTIYRWDGASWVAFIKTGTIDHTQLSSQNGDTNYLHISLAELSSLTSQSHNHSNSTVLDAITSLGSGIVISDAERLRIPSSDEKDALAGSVYVPLSPPASSNRYVTSIDPRLNTVKNPYVTFGLPGTGATYTGTDIADFDAALAELATGGSVEYIHALEILPPDPFNNTKLPPEPTLYDFNGGVNWWGISWTDPNPLLIENLATTQAIFKMAPQPSYSMAFFIGPGDGKVTVRGITFQLGSIGTMGAFIQRSHTVFEDCVFVGTGTNPYGMTIDAPYCKIIRCIFRGTLAGCITVVGDDTTIDSCQFEMVSPTSPAINVLGNNCLVTSSSIHQGSIFVGSVKDATFDKVRMADTSVFSDLGENTRWLGGIHQKHQQAYIGRTRTLGPINSHADFRGTSDAVFTAALSNPYTTEIEVLEGTYAFTAPVTIPSGKSIKTVRYGAVNITGGHCFIAESHTKIDGVQFTFTGSSGITVSGQDNIVISNCRFVMNGPDVPTQYAVNMSSVTDVRITGCQFSGTRGVYLTDNLRSMITHNTFSNNVYSTVTDTLTTSELYYGDNTEDGSICLLGGGRGIVRGNQFLGALPTKLNTNDTLWIGNYPATANNTNGIDNITLTTGDVLQPVLTTGAEKSSFLGIGSIAFSETGTPTAVTLPICIGARLDRSKGYNVKIAWTAAIYSGNVKWEVTTVFRDRADYVSDLGNPNVVSVLSPRTHYTVKQEETCTLTFTDYGYIAGVDPTHVAIMVRRISDDPDDTMPGVAYLTDVTITLPRD